MDIRFAVLCCLIATVNTGRGAAKPLIETYMVDKFLAGNEQSVEEMCEFMVGFAERHNARLETEGRT